MVSCYVISDLHLFSRRSQAATYETAMDETLRAAETVVLAGDIVDFRWSELGSGRSTIVAARAWLEERFRANVACRFHYVLGNHDHRPDWMAELDRLAQEHIRFSWEPYHLRLGNAFFVHGDVADPLMSAGRLSASRARFARHPMPARWKHHAYDWTVASRLHVATAKLWYPNRVVIRRLHRYLQGLEPGLGEGVRNVYFGHTHRALAGRMHEGVRYHNGGAPMPGMPFRIWTSGPLVMKPALPVRGDCYSAKERAWMTAWQNWRAVTLKPLYSCLARWRVSPDGVTLVSLLFGIAFYPLLAVSPLIAFGCLLVHAILDGLDGPLARYLGTASRRGSFTDTMADQIVVTVVTAALVKVGWIGVEAGIAYLVTYAIVVTFAIVRNALSIPYSWVIRPRLLVYMWLPVECYAWPGSLEWGLWGCVVLLGIKAITGFLRIRERL